MQASYPGLWEWGKQTRGAGNILGVPSLIQWISIKHLLYTGNTYNATLDRVRREDFCEEVTF